MRRETQSKTNSVLGKISGKPIEDVKEPCNRPGLVSLADKEPQIALEWCYSKNCGFGPEDFSFGSQVNAWWQCSRNEEHVWRVRILTRCVQKRGCPFCLGTNLRVAVPFERSLAFIDPSLSSEWHLKKNGALSPAKVLSHSKKIVWWQCKQNPKHSWQQTICRRVIERTGCPKCYKDTLHSLDKYPEALKFYDVKKNSWLKPEQVCLRTVVWWRCPVATDHSWIGPFKKKMNCPFCTNRKLSSTSSLLAVFPKLAAQVHPTRNGNLTADKIRAYGKQSIWWRCSYNPRHVWQAQVDNRTRNGSGCPECWKIRRPKYFKKLAAERLANPEQ